MPWRKYKPKQGKYGPIYYIDRGIQIRKDHRNIWTIFIEKGGKRKSKTIGEGRDSLSTAIKAAESIGLKLESASSIVQDEKPESSLPEFLTYSKDWYKNNTGRWKPATIERYDEMLRLHIWPDKSFKGKTLDQIPRRDIKGFLKRLFKTHSAATVELAYSVLSGIFSEAVDDDLTSANPVSGLLKRVLPPSNQRDQKAAEPFNYEERDLFLLHAERICSPGQLLIVKVMTFGGFRLGEVLAMRHRNLDFDKKTYHVQESFRRRTFSTPKKGKHRLVDLPDSLITDLQSYSLLLRKEALKQGTAGCSIDLLFLDPKEKGWPYSQRKIQALMKRVCKQAHLTQRNPHDLRHTYASTMLTAGLSPAYVQKQLGHSSISMTVDIYGHWIAGEGRGDLEKALQIPVQNHDDNRILSHIKNRKACN